ncbi:MAG: VOC family protein [Steroidobacteraceae bacterium]
MQVTTHLGFNGNCKAAFEFYAETLDGRITVMMTQGESPMADKVPTQMKDKIMHATLEFPGGGTLMGADHPQGKKVQPSGFCVSIQAQDAAAAERMFNGLAEGGKVQMAFQKTFWSPGFGMCTDKFDIPWMVNCVGSA